MSASSFDFWQRWLLIASLGFAVFGVVVALWPDAPFLAPWNDAVARTFYGGAEPESAAAFRSFVLAPLGATIAGSYVLQTFIAAVPFARRERWAWWASVVGLTVWFVTDSALSFGHGAAFNVWMINLVPVLIFALPLGATYPAFHRT